MEPEAMLESGQSEALERRFPRVQPNTDHIIRSHLDHPTALAPYQIPLPDPCFGRKDLMRIWKSSPIHISDDDVVSLEKETEFLGPRWRVVTTRHLTLPSLTYFSLGTRIVFKGVDADDISYVVIGYRITRASVNYIDIAAYKKGERRPVSSDSDFWPPFTMTVPSNTIHPTLKDSLSKQSKKWMEKVNSRTTSEEAERRLVVVNPGEEEELRGFLGFGYLKGFLHDIYSALHTCIPA